MVTIAGLLGDTRLTQHGWSCSLDASNLPVYRHPALGCFTCSEPCEFHKVLVKVSGEPSCPSVRTSTCIRCVKRATSEPCAGAGHWIWDEPTSRWVTHPAAAEELQRTMQPNIHATPLPLLTTATAELDDFAAACHRGISPILFRNLGAHQAPLNAARRGFSLRDVSQEIAWYNRPDIKCKHSSSQKSPTVVAFTRMSGATLVIGCCEACYFKPLAARKLCGLCNHRIAPDGRLTGPDGRTHGNAYKVASVERLISQAEDKLNPAVVHESSKSSTGRKILTTQIREILNSKGHCHFVNPAFNDNHLIDRQQAIEGLSTLRAVRRYSYLPADKGWKMMLRRDRETKDMTLLQLYRTGAPEGNKLRLSSDKLVSALSFDKLYESLLLPEDIASAEEAVWAKLGSATSFIADLGLESPLRSPPFILDDILQPVVAREACIAELATETTIVLGPDTVLPWHRQKLHMGATWTHLFGAPIVWYISPYQIPDSLLEVLKKYDNTDCQYAHGDIAFRPDSTAILHVQRVVLHPGQVLTVAPGSVVQAVSLGLSAVGRRIMADETWRSSIASGASTCEHDALLDQWLELFQPIARTLDVDMNALMDTYCPVERGLGQPALPAPHSQA